MAAVGGWAWSGSGCVLKAELTRFPDVLREGGGGVRKGPPGVWAEAARPELPLAEVGKRVGSKLAPWRLVGMKAGAGRRESPGGKGPLGAPVLSLGSPLCCPHCPRAARPQNHTRPVGVGCTAPPAAGWRPARPLLWSVCTVGSGEVTRRAGVSPYPRPGSLLTRSARPGPSAPAESRVLMLLSRG